MLKKPYILNFLTKNNKRFKIGKSAGFIIYFYKFSSSTITRQNPEINKLYSLCWIKK